MCMCVYMCACMCVHLCVCVCVCMYGCKLVYVYVGTLLPVLTFARTLLPVVRFPFIHTLIFLHVIMNRKNLLFLFILILIIRIFCSIFSKIFIIIKALNFSILNSNNFVLFVLFFRELAKQLLNHLIVLKASKKLH